MGWSFVDAAAVVHFSLVLGAFVALLEGFGALAALPVASDPFVVEVAAAARKLVMLA